MKTCSRCTKSKNEDEFSKKRGGKQPYCKSCQSEAQKVYYRANKAAQVARCAKRKNEIVKENQEKIISYLQTHPCVDFGETDIVVLQFDHVRGKKRTEIGRMLAFSWASIEAEIEKCVVRCANDHTRKTAKEQKHYKFMWSAISSGRISPS